MKKTMLLLSLGALCLALPLLPVTARVGTAKNADKDNCTTIVVARGATTDGSVITSESCDGHDGRVWVDRRPAAHWPKGAKVEIRSKTDLQYAPDDLRPTEALGTIPQVPETNGYLNTIYPAMNSKQLAIGESTFDGKEIMHSDNGLINCYELTRLMAERCDSARCAIDLAADLLARYGWNDVGETVTLADPEEAWLMEIVGPGSGRKGAVWVARRVPDEHITVAANASRIRRVDCTDERNFRCSENLFSTAQELGLWSEDSGEPFEFCYVYAERGDLGSSRREWRVFDLAAPSLGLNPNAENFPFSVKPDHKIGVAEVMAMFRDTYEDTPFDMRQFMKTTDEDGKTVLSPYASPFLLYDQMPLYGVWGAWGADGERTIARWYCINTWITQSRSWLPDAVGGVAWLGFDNPATTTWIPMYAGMQKVPASFLVGGELYDGGRPPFTRDSAWWAFNRASTLVSQRWGDMRHDLADVRDGLQKEAFVLQAELDREAAALAAAGEPVAPLLDARVIQFADRVVAEYWQLGDDLWTRYDEKW